MAKILESERDLELLVNCKTYPAVSKKYIETVCTGGVEPDGSFVRLYPVPFRFLDGSEKYKRWDIIRVRAYRDTKDTRPESWHLIPGTPIKIIDKASTTVEHWYQHEYAFEQKHDCRCVQNGQRDSGDIGQSRRHSNAGRVRKR